VIGDLSGMEELAPGAAASPSVAASAPSDAALSAVPHPSPLRAIAGVFGPLALSSVLMIAAEQTIVVSGVARLAQPEVALAAYGIALSLSIVVEAPVIMLLTTSVALVRDRQSYHAVRRFALALGGALFLLNLLLYWGPLYDLLIVPLLRLPPAVAEAAHLPLRWMALWPLAISYRKFNQGVLITARRARAIGLGTVMRILTAALVTLAGVRWFRPPGALLAGLALISAVLVESALIAWWSRAPARQTVLRVEREGPLLTAGALWSFHAPLIGTAGLRVLLQPLISAGITRLPLAALSLAVWPVAYGADALAASPAAALPELALTFRRSPAEVRAVARFSVALGLTLTVCLALALLTPLSHLYFGLLLGVPPAVEAAARRTLWLLLPIPVLTATQALLRAALAAGHRTAAVQGAMAANVAVVAATLTIGTALGLAVGTTLAAIGMTLALLVENGVLLVALRRPKLLP
jgi:Na+-driven multidrug efflux pump